MYFLNAGLVPIYHRQVYKPKCSGGRRGGGDTNGSRERREKESLASVNTQPLTLLQRHQGY